MLHPQEIAPSISPELAALAAGRAHDPFGSLGWHRGADGWTFRTLQPFAESVSAETARGWEPLTHVPDTPLFELRTAGAPPQHTRLRVTAGGARRELLDPYSFPPAVGAEDLWLFNSGAARQAWRALGAHAIEIDGVAGTRFAVWAPNAERVSVVGDFNRWDGRAHMMRSLGVVVALNFTPVPRAGYRLGVPQPGRYRELFNSDSTYYGGANLGNAGGIAAEGRPYMGLPCSVTLTLPPLACVVLAPG